MSNSSGSVEFAPAFPNLVGYGGLFARSEANLAASVIEGAVDEKKSSPVRRTFLLVSLLDLIVIALFWILFLNMHPGGFIAALKMDVNIINFNSTMFDNMILVGSRFLFIQITYGGFKSQSIAIMAIITAGSTIFTLVKAIMFDYGTDVKNINLLAATLMILNILIPWIETIFLECRVFPQEKAAQAVYSAIGDVLSVRSLGQKPSSRYAASRVVSIYGSPNASLNGFQINERISVEEDEDEAAGVDIAALIQMGDSIYESSLTLLDDSTWHMHLDKLFATSNKLMVQMAHITGYKSKLFRLDGILEASPLVVFREVVHGVNSSATWNPLLSHAKRLQHFQKQNIDIVHTIVDDQAKGLVKSRDFVIMRKWGESSRLPGQLFITSSSVEHPKCPPIDGRIRAHQYISATTLTPVDTDASSSDVPCHTHFTMIMCTDLKGWLPQSLIDQATTGTLETFFRALQRHLNTYTIGNDPNSRWKRNKKAPKHTFPGISESEEHENQAFEPDQARFLV